MAAYGWLGSIREPIRRAFFRVLRQALETDDGRRLIADASADPGRVRRLPRRFEPTDYRADLPAALPDPARPAPVFITARFRTGSTLLWQIFRNVASCRSYYEPLNERRFFDPATRGARVDPTHRGVDDYWREYDGLESLGRWYRQEWISRRLHMDEHDWDPDLRAYIRQMIEAAAHRAVLQFNRVDFRLPWLRHEFPDARVLHLYRHPREQWCSSLVDPARFPHTGTMAAFEPRDAFYLLSWARDLAYRYPFLDPRTASHPYELFYYLWRLSYDFGRQYAHASFGFEALCASPDTEIPRLMTSAGVDDYDLAALRAIVTPPAAARWPKYAPREWFQSIEARCEETLTRFAPAE